MFLMYGRIAGTFVDYTIFKNKKNDTKSTTTTSSSTSQSIYILTFKLFIKDYLIK